MTSRSGAPLLDDNFYAGRNPFQTFLFALSLLSSLPLLVGNAGSATLERELPNLAVSLWGLCLFLGSALVLTAEAWRRHAWLALVLERAGMMLVGVAAFVYVIVVLTASRHHFNDVRYLAAIHVGYSLACFVRARAIHQRMGWHRRQRITA